MNFDRTFSGYNWLAWTARGGLNDGRVGGNVTFADAHVESKPFDWFIPWDDDGPQAHALSFPQLLE